MSIRLAVASSMMAVLGLGALGCEAPGVGDPCTPTAIPEGGFEDTEVFLENPSLQCRSRICIVNHYQGDLNPDPRQGDEYADCDAPVGEAGGWQCIEDRIYCTCKCGVSAGGDPNTVTCDECPDGFECCPIFSIGGDGFKGDYCVRDGTCQRGEE